MIIDKLPGKIDIPDRYLNEPPDDFVSDKKKQTPAYIKWVMDYYSNKAYNQFFRNKKTIGRNYDLLKGIIDARDFYEEDDQIASFMDDLISGNTLPSYVKNYPMTTSFVNQLVGELMGRIDNSKFRAYDQFSQQEEFDYKTGVMEQFVFEKAYARIVRKLQMKGEDLGQIDPDEIEQTTWESVKDQVTDYTSEGEIWANATLTAVKAELNTDEKREDTFRDLLVANEFAYHTYADNSRRGISAEVLNPLSIVDIGDKDEKFLHKKNATGYVKSMSLTEIINRFTDLTKDEIDWLRKQARFDGEITTCRSNLFNNVTGTASVRYNAYDEMLQKEREIASFMEDTHLGLQDIFTEYNATSNTTYRYTVVEMYYWGKKKVGKLTFLDENGDEQYRLVDENYIPGSPNEVEIEWGYVNQLMHGRKIGSQIYSLKPYTLMERMPITGVRHEIKNTSSVSFVGLTKPFQVLYDICWNQIYELSKKEKGRQLLMSTRYVPSVKDGDDQDAIDLWLEEMERDGVLFVDDSPENLKGAASMNQFTAVDLTRSQEIASRMALATQLRAECGALLGFTPQRLGTISATETAEGTKTALTQSYAQTEPYFKIHKYVTNEFYQTLMEAIKNIEARNENSTLSYLNDMGMDAFVQMTGSQLELLDLHLVSTDNNEDNKLFQELRGLAQPMLQNGATVHDISLLFGTNSIRQWQKATKVIAEQKKAFEQQQLQIQQQQLQQQQQQAQAQLQYQAQKDAQDRQDDNWNKEQDRQVKLQLGLMTYSSYNPENSTDSNGDNVPDIIERTQANLEKTQSRRADQGLKAQELSLKEKEMLSKREIDLKKLNLEKSNQANDIQVAKINASNRNNKQK